VLTLSITLNAGFPEPRHLFEQTALLAGAMHQRQNDDLPPRVYHFKMLIAKHMLKSALQGSLNLHNLDA
jgi:hypothetical protein